MAAFFTVACVLCGRFEFALVGVPFLISLVLANLDNEEPSYTIASECARERCFEGDTVHVRVTISAESPLPFLEVYHFLCTEGGRVVSTERMLISMRRGEIRQLESKVSLTERGAFVLGRVHSRVLSPTGAKWLDGTTLPGTVCVVYPRVEPLHVKMTMTGRPRPYGGDHASRLPGEGFDLAGLREYRSGDPIRRINWRASSRWKRLYVNESFPERNIDVIVVIDTLRDVGVGCTTYLDCGARAAASTASHFLSRKNRVGMINYGCVLEWVVPRSGARQLHVILDKLARLRTSESFAFKDVKAIPDRALPPRALVFVITPLLDERSDRMVGDLAARGFDPVVMYISPIELTRKAIGDSVADGLAQKWWTLLQESRVKRLRNLGITVAKWDGTEPLGACLGGSLGPSRRHVTGDRPGGNYT
jgi:uncharacterized protein (DUF58 family)